MFVNNILDNGMVLRDVIASEEEVADALVQSIEDFGLDGVVHEDGTVHVQMIDDITEELVEVDATNIVDTSLLVELAKAEPNVKLTETQIYALVGVLSPKARN